MNTQHTEAPAKWQPKPTKKATFDTIKMMLATNDRACVKGLLAVYANQTSDEQTAADVKHHNGVGFTVQDAHFLTALAQQYIAKQYLSEKQMQWLRKLMLKYAGQLTQIAIAKHGLNKGDDDETVPG